jgi:epoxyqueuosine reductase
VLEKPLAAQAGIGWQGKHSNLVSRDFGSWLFLGEIFTTLELAADAPEVDHCGSCTRCITACPTGAIVEPYRLDARRCLAYLNNEHHGPIPRAYRAAMGNRVYGCDDCLAVCPWNKYAQASKEVAFQLRPSLEGARLEDFLSLDDGAFRALFSKSPIKRLGRDRFLRNLVIACGNSGLAHYVPALTALLGDDAPVVRGAAVWALAALLEPAAWQALKAAHLPGESDSDVCAEWEAGA